MQLIKNDKQFWLVLGLDASEDENNCIAVAHIKPETIHAINNMISNMDGIDGLQQVNFIIENTPSAVVQQGPSKVTSSTCFVLDKAKQSLSLAFDGYPLANAVPLELINRALDYRNNYASEVASLSNGSVDGVQGGIWMGTDMLYMDKDVLPYSIAEGLDHLMYCMDKDNCDSSDFARLPFLKQLSDLFDAYRGYVAKQSVLKIHNQLGIS